jgi:glycosyltransferase involved in cell wall biosynthesis
VSDSVARPRVLLMTETYWPETGGGERQARVLARSLVESGHDVTIVARRSRADLPRNDVDGRLRILRLPPAGRGRWRKWALVPPAFVALLWLRGRYDVVLVSGFRFLGIAALSARVLTGTPTVLKADSSGELSGEYFRAGLGAGGIRLESWPVRCALRLRNALLRRSDAFVSLSEEMTREFVEHGVPAGRVRCITNGVDTRVFRPAAPGERAALRKRLALPGGAVAVYTGRLVSYKGLPMLLHAWRGIPDATLVLVGEGGHDAAACEHELQEFAAQNRMGDRVRFVGPSDDVQDWLRAADLFVFPTENEAFGLSLAEAMACALPSVTTSVGGLRDFVADGTNALVVEPGDAAGTVAAVRRLLDDAEMRARLGRAARETAERFDAAATAARYADLFSTLTARSPATR